MSQDDIKGEDQIGQVGLLPQSVYFQIPLYLISSLVTVLFGCM